MVCLAERVREEIPQITELTEVTPANIGRFDFTKLDWNPYFSGKHPFREITGCPEIQARETLHELIPAYAIQTRVDAVTSALARTIFRDPEEFVVGAIPKGGLWLYEKLLKKLEEISVWGLKTINFGVEIDIKSRHATETGEYEVRSLPDPKQINGKTFVLCEGVADTTQTLQMAQNTLTQPPYKDVHLWVVLLVDKIDAHPGAKLPDCVKQTLFQIGKVWMVGCGPDTDQRFRNLPYIAVYKKSKN